jgi:diguanylate cyclase (GGDEF)-like protein
LIVFPGCTLANLIVGAERLRQSIASHPVETSAGPVAVTLSLGLASVEQDEKETLGCEGLLRAADEALYAAKARGRNRVEVGPTSHAAGLRGD